MQRWIMEKTEEHFQEAKKENKNSFRAVDPDGDGESHRPCPRLKNTSCQVKSKFWFHGLCVGHVTWDEYRVKFLASKGFNEKEIAEKIKNNEDLKLDEESKLSFFPPQVKSAKLCCKSDCGVNIYPIFISTAQEVLESLKDRWFQADNLPADQLLNEEEFLSFLHPEHSRGMLKYMVKEIVRDLGMFYL